MPVEDTQIAKHFTRTTAWLNSVDANLRSRSVWKLDASASSFILEEARAGSPTIDHAYAEFGNITTKRWGRWTPQSNLDKTHADSTRILKTLRTEIDEAEKAFNNKTEFTFSTLESILENSSNTKIIGSIYTYAYWYVINATICSSCNFLLLTEEAQNLHHIFSNNCSGASSFRMEMARNERHWVDYNDLVISFKLSRAHQEFLLKNIKLKWDDMARPLMPSWVQSMLQQSHEFELGLTLEEVYELYRSQSSTT